MMEKIKSLYLGIDPTADDIHIGHIYMIEKSIKYAKDNNMKFLLLIGDYTCQIGDPSDKEESRDIKEYQFYQKNIESLSRIILNRLKKTDIEYEIVYNSNWLNILSMKEWLENFGSTSINSLLKIKFFSSRIKNSINLPLREAIYFSLQAYDFLYLRKNYNCVCQIAGIDQTNNVLHGMKTINREYNDCYYKLFPLLVDSKNRKFSKSIMGGIVNSSPHKCFNSLISIDDKIMKCENKFQKHLAVIDIFKKYRNKTDFLNLRTLNFKFIKKDPSNVEIIMYYTKLTYNQCVKILKQFTFNDKYIQYKNRQIIFLYKN